MDDINVIDDFTSTFIAYIDSGFGLLAGDVGFLTAILIGIDIVLVGVKDVGPLCWTVIAICLEGIVGNHHLQHILR